MASELESSNKPFGELNRLDHIWARSKCKVIAKYRDHDEKAQPSGFSTKCPATAMTFTAFCKMVLDITDGGNQHATQPDKTELQEIMSSMNQDINEMIFSEDCKHHTHHRLLFSMRKQDMKPIKGFAIYLNIVADVLKKPSHMIQLSYIRSVIETFAPTGRQYEDLFEYHQFFKTYGSVEEQLYWATFDDFLSQQAEKAPSMVQTGDFCTRKRPADDHQSPKPFASDIEQETAIKRMRTETPTAQQHNSKAMVLYNRSFDFSEENGNMSSSYIEQQPTYFLPYGEYMVGTNSEFVIGAMYQHLFFETAINKTTFKSKIIAVGHVFKILQKEYFDENTTIKVMFRLQEKRKTREIVGLQVKIKLSFQKMKECDPVEEEHVLSFSRHITAAEKARENERRLQNSKIEELQGHIDLQKEKLFISAGLISSMEETQDKLKKENSHLTSEFSKYKAMVELQAEEISQYRGQLHQLSQAVSKLSRDTISILNSNGKKEYTINGVPGTECPEGKPQKNDNTNTESYLSDSLNDSMESLEYDKECLEAMQSSEAKLALDHLQSTTTKQKSSAQLEANQNPLSPTTIDE